MGIVKSVVEKARQDGTKYWVTVIEGEGEVLAYDSQVVGLEGKPCPFEIGVGQKGGKYIKFPKAGGFQKGGAGGGWKGKSDLEIKAQVLTMSMAYAKDLMVAYMQTGATDIPLGLGETVLKTYRELSSAILADLAKLVPDVPKPTEAPKTETKAHEKPPQETSLTPAGTDTGTLSAKDNLKVKMKAYLKGRNADTDNAFNALLIELTEFPGKDRKTGELTGKMVFIDDIDDKKFSDKWALTAYGKLKTLIEQEESKGANDMQDDDVRY